MTSTHLPNPLIFTNYAKIMHCRRMYIPHTTDKCDGISVHAGDTIMEVLEKMEPHIIFGTETDTPYYSFE